MVAIGFDPDRSRGSFDLNEVLLAVHRAVTRTRGLLVGNVAGGTDAIDLDGII